MFLFYFKINFNIVLSLDASVGIATVSVKDKRFVSSVQHSNRLWGLPSLLHIGY
jgi:hypothetical protein